MHDLQDLINQFENVANQLKVVVFDNANLDFQQKGEEVNINNNNNNKTQEVSNRLFEVIELHEGEPITSQSSKRNKKQTNASRQDKNVNKKRYQSSTKVFYTIIKNLELTTVLKRFSILGLF
jgi:hypothetical protein